MENKSTVAGILSCVSGVIGVFGGLVYAVFLNYWMRAMSQFMGPAAPPNFTDYWFRTIGLIYIIMGSVAAAIGVFAIIAAVFTIKRKSWGLALAGTIASTLIFFPCGIPAIIIISSAQNEFKH